MGSAGQSADAPRDSRGHHRGERGRTPYVPCVAIAGCRAGVRPIDRGSIMGQLKVGQKIRIVEMVGEPQYSGRTGVVEHIDDIGQVHGSWGGCALRPMDGDKWEVIG